MRILILVMIASAVFVMACENSVTVRDNNGNTSPNVPVAENSLQNSVTVRNYNEGISPNVLAVENSLQNIEDELRKLDISVRFHRDGKITTPVLKLDYVDAANVFAVETKNLQRLAEEASLVPFPSEAIKHRQLHIDYIELRRLGTLNLEQAYRLLSEGKTDQPTKAQITQSYELAFELFRQADDKNKELMTEAIILMEKGTK